MTRCVFISRRGSVAYVAVTYDESGGNLPGEQELTRLRDDIISEIDQARAELLLHRAEPVQEGLA